jgi:hypothetical protein
VVSSVVAKQFPSGSRVLIAIATAVSASGQHPPCRKPPPCAYLTLNGRGDRPALRLFDIDRQQILEGRCR